MIAVSLEMSDEPYKGIVGNKFEVPARSILTLVGVE